MIIVEYVLGLNHTFKGILLVEHLCHFGVAKLSIFRSNSKKLYNMFMAPKGSITNIIVQIDVTYQIFVRHCVNIK